MRLYAAAKINWTLEALGRPDSYQGYHEVRTVMQTIDLCDTLEVERAAGLDSDVRGPAESSEGRPTLRVVPVHFFWTG